MLTKHVRVSEVFVPGGFPQVTYIAREEHQLELRVKSANDNLSKLLVITGPTKSGKTVLVDKIFPQDSSIWIDGGTIGDEQSFWDSVLERAELFNTVEKNEGNELSGELSAEISAEGNIFIAKGGSSVSGTVHASSNTNSIYSRSVNSKIVAVNALRTQKIPLIIDDFHYIEKSVQKAIVRALKSPIMHGLPVIFIAISEHSGRSMFDKLKRGPRARTDRKARKLRNGSVTDIYGLVMAL